VFLLNVNDHVNIYLQCSSFYQIINILNPSTLGDYV
jgi:hypothetical protein